MVVWRTVTLIRILEVPLDSVNRHAVVLGVDNDIEEEIILYFPLDRPNGAGFTEIKPGYKCYLEGMEVYPDLPGVRHGLQVVQFSPGWETEINRWV